MRWSQKGRPPVNEAATRECPFCAETIKAAALLCRFCGRELPPPVSPAASAPATAPAPPAAGAAGAVLHEAELLELLTALVQKSLVVYEEDEEGRGRYRLLETVRQYARDRLLEAGEGEAVRERHRDWFLGLAEGTGPKLGPPDSWMDRVEREHDNLRAALAWSGAQGQGEKGLRLGGALWWFWQVRSYLGEGREHLAGLLALPGTEARTMARAKALDGAGALAWFQGDYGAARALVEESLAIWRELGNKHGTAWSLTGLGIVARDQGEYGLARALLEESLAIYRELGDKRNIAWPLTILGEVVHNEGDSVAARVLLEESLAISREAGVRKQIAMSLDSLGSMAREQGDLEAARALHEESVAINCELGEKEVISWSLTCRGWVAHGQGEYGTARARFEESLAINRERGEKRGTAQNLEGLAAVAVAQSQPKRAARLFGAAEGLRQAMGTPLPPAERAEHDRSVAAVRTALGAEPFAAAWAEGRALSLEEACAYALEEVLDD
jgi:tetratricopeptide (TPR) repeat protein